MPLSSDTAAPALGRGNPPRFITEKLCICEEVWPAGAAVIYAPDDLDKGAALAGTAQRWLEEGKTVAIKGGAAEAFVNRYLLP